MACGPKGHAISIHALLAESDNLRVVDGSKSSIISIHALLAESDRGGHIIKTRTKNFYPRSPCGERLEKVPADVFYQAFLSTLSLRRATLKKFPLMCFIRHFYPRSPCGERRHWPGVPLVGRSFLSTLSLRRATVAKRTTDIRPPFLSTLSLRRATHFDNFNLHCVEISIHALLAESDSQEVFWA